VTLGSHQRTVGASQVHLTPRWILRALGPFDMDPCAASPRPWDCARVNITEAQDGLSMTWTGRVFLNPPFDRYQVARWTRALAEHGDGIALLHARTEAGWFDPLWDGADSILFMADRIKFCRPDGSEQPANSGAPPVLVAFGETNTEALRRSGTAGRLVTVWEQLPMVSASEIEDLRLHNSVRGDDFNAGFDAARAAIASYVERTYGDGVELAAKIRGVQPVLSTAPAATGSEGQ